MNFHHALVPTPKSPSRLLVIEEGRGDFTTTLFKLPFFDSPNICIVSVEGLPS